MSRSSSAKSCVRLWQRLRGLMKLGEWSSCLFSGLPTAVETGKETVREMYRNGLSTVARHVTDHQAMGESLLDNEKEFAIRCNC